MIDEERFGELKHFESHFDRFRPVVRERWKEQATDGGGILFDLGFSHLLGINLSPCLVYQTRSLPIVDPREKALIMLITSTYFYITLLTLLCFMVT